MLRLLVGFILGVSVALGVGAFAMDPSSWLQQQQAEQQYSMLQYLTYQSMRQQQMLEDMQQKMKRNPCR